MLKFGVGTAFVALFTACGRWPRRDESQPSVAPLRRLETISPLDTFPGGAILRLTDVEDALATEPFAVRVPGAEEDGVAPLPLLLLKGTDGELRAFVDRSPLLGGALMAVISGGKSHLLAPRERALYDWDTGEVRWGSPPIHLRSAALHRAEDLLVVQVL